MTTAAKVENEVLTPSEAVLLFGDRFLKKSMFGEKLLLADHKVSTADLANKMMAAAILANEQLGLIKLRVEKGKALFGLMKTEKLMIAPGSGVPSWPAQSPESGLLKTLGKNDMVLKDLLIAYIGDIAASPEGDFIHGVKGGLAERGLVTAEVKKMLGMNVGTNVSLTPDQRARIEQNGPASAQALFAAAEKSENFEKIKNAVSVAFSDRTQEAAGGD
jgi:hypothetical protein